jgi:hypothetical protein
MVYLTTMPVAHQRKIVGRLGNLLEVIWKKTATTYVGFEVSTAVVMKSIIFWDITPSACHLLARWFAELILRP